MFLDQYLQGVFGLTKKESEDVCSLFEKTKIKKGGHIQTVPQQHIASMLGMSPETLSRFRAKHTINFS